MRKHTPGPWTAHARTVTAPETEDRLGLNVQINGGNREDNKANARLIAAAPDLLEALQAATEVLEILRRGHGVQVSEACFPVLNDCRDTIDKATGAAS